MAIEYQILARDPESNARVGVFKTKHGVLTTPFFMTIGTYGAVKALSRQDLLVLDAPIVLSNTYHLYLKPGADYFREHGGLHNFMAWPRPILTDSGGFQIHSLAKFCKTNDDGVSFQSHIDGSKHTLTPEKVVDIQTAIGSDIAMPLDKFSPNPADRSQVSQDVDLTLKWLRRTAETKGRQELNMFAIVQGGVYSHLRQRCAEAMLPLGFDGYAIGGLSVGEDKEAMHTAIAATLEVLPDNAPRYLMGVGTPEDLVNAITQGVDMFDCVLPTRNARNGCLFTSFGKLNIFNAQFASDQRPLDEECRCFVCQNHSRAYIRYLLKNGELLGLHLGTFHNVHYYLRLMEEVRSAIEEGNFSTWRKQFFEKRNQPSGDMESRVGS